MTTPALPGAPGTDAADDVPDVTSNAARAGDPAHGSGWGPLIVTALCRGLLVMLASMTLWAVLPAALGWQVTVVMSGSMEPALRPGDVVASRPVSGDSVRPGQVVLVDDPDHRGRLRLHRLAKVTDNGRLVLRGDANRADDSTPVRRNAVRGVGSLRVPYIGAPVYWLRTHRIAPLLPTGTAIALIALGAIGRRDNGDPPDDGTSSTGPRRGRRVRLRHARRKTLVILTTAALTAASVATDAPAQAATAFRAVNPTHTASWLAARSFSTSCKTAALADTPYLYYPLSEKSGATARDVSGNRRDGSYEKSLLFGGIAYGTAGPCSSDGTTGITLDGSYGWVSTPGSITAPKTFTAEIWFRTTTTSGGALISFRSPEILGLFSSYDRQLYLDNAGHLVFGLTGSKVTTTLASPTKYNDGSWHLADATVSSAGTQLYVDGDLVGSNTSMTSPIDATGAWRVGDGGFSGWTPAPSSARAATAVHGAAIYPAALDANRIAGHYVAP